MNVFIIYQDKHLATMEVDTLPRPGDTIQINTKRMESDSRTLTFIVDYVKWELEPDYSHRGYYRPRVHAFITRK